MPTIGFRLAILGTLFFVVNLALSIILFQVHQANVDAAKQTAIELFEQIGGRVTENIQSHMDQAAAAAEVVSSLKETAASPTGAMSDHAIFALFRALQTRNPGIYSTYVGYGNGAFSQLIAVRDQPSILSSLKAPAGTQEARRIILPEGSSRVQFWWFMGEGGAVLEHRREENPAYDPRKRPWYGAALSTEEAVFSDPYVFSSTARPGLTVSHTLPLGNGVVGVDITLDELSRLAASQKVSSNGRVVLTDDKGRVLGASEDILGTASPLAALADVPHPLAQLLVNHNAPEAGVQALGADGQDYLAKHYLWQGSGIAINIHVLAPFDDFAGHIRKIDLRILLISLAVLIGAIPLGLWLAKRLSGTIDDLALDAERIREMDFTGETPQKTPIREIQILADTFKAMKKHILERTRTLNASQETLRRLIELGVSLGAESDPGKISETALAEAMRLTNADGGTLYIRVSEQRLKLAIIRNDTLGLRIGGASGEEMDLPELDLWSDDGGTPLRDNVIADAVHGGQLIAISDIHAWDKHDMHGVIDFDHATGYLTQSMLIIPLKPPSGEVVGVLQLINPKDEAGRFATIGGVAQRHVMALAGQVAVALQNRSLIQAQEALVDSMVGIISSAIDAKSPYTGDHASRLAHIALMLADEAGKSQDAAFSSFDFSSPDVQRELRIAALLHDCGKVTTPEYVVDKATKLETIHNRIHEVRTRFEVLLRDAEIARLTSITQGADPASADTAFAARRQELLDDFAFVAQCNVGSEQMDQEDVSRLAQIARQTWLRNFDDRLGLSIEEMRRLADVPQTPMPAVEPLLSNRPEQRISWTGLEKFHKSTWGFTLPIPKVMYDRGEIYNLSISRGTLTAEERFKISEHAVQGIIMLESLPFPRQLQRVPEIACAHHEAVNGKGYPRSLDKSAMSVSARILAIADVFEALTAADRPYKKPKTLSESIGILAGFRDRQHIDSDLFALFLRTGVYRRYAETFLSPEQIDSVDVEKYLN
ncbi:MAG: HD domain-containing protein [Alphaproteobacteria bacterium]|nr:HD domain-containing protein [Alphaproteobacteria bacterium]